MRVQLIAALVAINIGVVESALVQLTPKEELELWRARVSVVHKMLKVECPLVMEKRELSEANFLDHLDIERQLYKALFNKLLECRVLAITKSVPSTSTQSASSISATTAPSTSTETRPTTTGEFTEFVYVTNTLSPPVECMKAVNYTEPWRLDHNGSHITPGGRHSFQGYACDFETSEWFRFSGAAGNRILDSCPEVEFSCGTARAVWTDEKMPKGIGVKTDVKIYNSFKGICKRGHHNIQVMRCSWDTPYDYIYKQPYSDDGICRMAFCSMK